VVIFKTSSYVPKTNLIWVNKLTIITLSNQNPDSQYREVSINLVTGRCKLSEELCVARNELLEAGFYHPLLGLQNTQVSNRLFHYEYDDIDELLQSARYVYSILLNADDPAACVFKINPSPIFRYAEIEEGIYFSVNIDKPAQERISIGQLEGIVSQIDQHSFQFIEGILIDGEFTMGRLPQSIDGDMLYRMDENLVDFLRTPRKIKRFELRYIDPKMRLGVFSRYMIKKGELLFFYGGLKKNLDSEYLNYAFIQKLDCLNLYIDAYECGNIGRFVNHSPNPDSKTHVSSTGLLEANIKTESYYLNGVQMVFFMANRDIFKGEQLLVDYGPAYFKKTTARRFKASDSRIVNAISMLTSQEKLRHIKVMASQGVEQAKQYLFLRMCVMAGLPVLFVIMLGIFL
jgi:hypothetical protein